MERKDREKYEREAQIEQTKDIRNGGTEGKTEKRKNGRDGGRTRGSRNPPTGQCERGVIRRKGHKFTTQVGGRQRRAVQI